jgi:hypothetical protein
MSEASWPFYESMASELIALVQAGQMTEATFTGLAVLMADRSSWSARTTELQNSLVGYLNSGSNVLTLEQKLEPWFISALEAQKEAINMPRSHSGCWCNC